MPTSYLTSGRGAPSPLPPGSFQWQNDFDPLRVGVLCRIGAGQTRIVMITDGTSNTFMVAESAGRPNFYGPGFRLQPISAANGEAGWADPNGGFKIKGSDPNPADYPGTKSNSTTVHGAGVNATHNPPFTCSMQCNNTTEVYSFHTGGCNFLFADGSVHFLSQSTSLCVIGSLATRAGGEVPMSY